jgi:hypothetical protein
MVPEALRRNSETECENENATAPRCRRMEDTMVSGDLGFGDWMDGGTTEVREPGDREHSSGLASSVCILPSPFFPKLSRHRVTEHHIRTFHITKLSMSH